MAQIRRLTAAGIEEARKFLGKVRAQPDTSMQVPGRILCGSEETCEIPGASEVQLQTFRSKRAAAVYLDASLGSFGAEIVDDEKVWSWLGMFYFAGTVRIVEGKMRLSPLDETFVIHRDDSYSFQRRYRHYLWSAWRLYRQHGEDAAFLLDQAPHEAGDIADRVLSNARVFNSVGVVKLIMHLYTSTQGQKAGFGRGPGGLRHLMRVLNQRERTHDVYGMAAGELLKLLPPEFDRWNDPPLAAS